MVTRFTDEFRRDAVRIGISSGLTRPHPLKYLCNKAPFDAEQVGPAASA